jgi:hypothetical protein
LDKIVVKLPEHPILQVSKRRRETIKVGVNENKFDPHALRIERIEAPVLRERGFVPLDNSMNQWQGVYKGYPCTVYFPPLYPAQPLEFRWKHTPPGFPNVIDENRLCTEHLVYEGVWTPDITIETVLEALDTHPYFQRRQR